VKPVMSLRCVWKCLPIQIDYANSVISNSAAIFYFHRLIPSRYPLYLAKKRVQYASGTSATEKP
jgi:hypothetical protein